MAALVTVLFFISGLVALVYEVVWIRALGLVVGTSLWAAVAVVAAFMGGMALGSTLVARLAGVVRHHLRWYAAAEALAAGAALSTVPAFAILGRFAARLGPEPLASWGLPLAGRLAVAWAFLLLPTVAMGATLPLLVSRVGRGPLGARVARLYGANTAGAVAGVLLAGYLGLPYLGESGTLAAAAALGLLVSGIALCIERRVPVSPEAGAPAGSPAGGKAWLLYPALFGFVALAAEMVWTRILLLHLGSRVYAFAVILAVYLVGLAVGAWLSRLARVEAQRALAGWQVALAFALTAEIPVLAHFGDLLAWLAVAVKPAGFTGVQLAVSVAVAILMLPATVAFGASFPLVVSACRVGTTDAARTGAVAAANTAGGIVGAVAGPLVVVPLLGTQDALLALGIVSAAAAWLLGRTRRSRWFASAAATAVLVTFVAVPSTAVLRGVASLAEGSVETVRESGSATVVVRRVEDARGTWRSLELNGLNVAGTSPDLRAIQSLQGHLPLLLDGRPERILHIGFGSGGTAWAVAQHRVGSITIAEISPEVLAVSDTVFGEVNHHVLHDPRVRVWLNDGRNALLATDERFDVILSDAVHPVYAGNSALYTREYFELCRRHLRPGGVVSMWLPMYSLSVASYATIVRAFWEVFPDTCVWYDPVVLNEFTIVTGSTSPGPVRVRWSQIGDPRLAATLAEAGIHRVEDLASMLLLGPGNVAYLVDGEPPHVDDFPTVEYRSGRLLDRDRSWLGNFRALYAARARSCPFADFPGDWAAVAAARDGRLAAQLRELGARVAAR